MSQDINSGPAAGEGRPVRDLRGRRLYRSHTNRLVAGVCGGLSELTGIDVTLIRLLWLLWVFLGGSGLIVYIIMAIVIPERPAGAEYADVPYSARWPEMTRSGTIILGAAIVVVGLLLLVNALGVLPVGLGYLWSLFWRLFWPLALISLGLLAVVGAFWGDREWWRGARWPAAGTVLRRSRSNRMVAGVCGGLGEYFRIDPTLVRLAWAIGSLGTVGAGILAYIVAAVIMPEEP
jgi:phage shock protein C